MGGRRLHEELPVGRKLVNGEQEEQEAAAGPVPATGPLAELQRKAGNAAVVGMLGNRSGSQSGGAASTLPATIAGFSLMPGAIAREWAAPQHSAATAEVVQRVKIAGFNLTSHASGQRNRKDIATPITNTDIESAISGGTAYDDGTGTGGVVYYLGDVAVVTAGKNIVTVYRTPQANKPKARWTKL